MTCPESLAENHKRIMETGKILNTAVEYADGTCDTPQSPSHTARIQQQTAKTCETGRY